MIKIGTALFEAAEQLEREKEFQKMFWFHLFAMLWLQDIKTY